MGAALAIAGRVGTAMVKPEQLREFRRDFELIRSALPTAERFLRAESEFTVARKTMADTRRAALDVAQALHRMHATKSYLDSYGSWSEMCRALGVRRQSAYRLMNLVKAIELSEIEPEEMTRGKAEAILKANRPTTVAIASHTNEDVDAAFADLQAELGAVVAKSEQPPKLAELEAPKGPPNATWASRQIGSLESWFRDRGAETRAAAHIQALRDIAKSVG